MQSISDYTCDDILFTDTWGFYFTETGNSDTTKIIEYRFAGFKYNSMVGNQAKEAHSDFGLSEKRHFVTFDTSRISAF